jgi:hypothetical protein
MSSTAHTRFICRVVRFKTALSGDAAQTSGHAANCPDCQAYFRADDVLVNALRRDTFRETQPSSEGLASRIALSVRQYTPRPRKSYAAVWTSLAGATAVVALSFFIVRQNSPQRLGSSENLAATDIRPADVANLVANVDSLRIRLLDSVEPTAEKIATQNPLTQELNSVQADARSALGFLAMNFLPSDSARSVEFRVDPTRS